jgi:hypothetical protein
VHFSPIGIVEAQPTSGLLLPTYRRQSAYACRASVPPWPLWPPCRPSSEPPRWIRPLPTQWTNLARQSPPSFVLSLSVKITQASASTRRCHCRGHRPPRATGACPGAPSSSTPSPTPADSSRAAPYARHRAGLPPRPSSLVVGFVAAGHPLAP